MWNTNVFDTIKKKLVAVDLIKEKQLTTINMITSKESQQKQLLNFIDREWDTWYENNDEDTINDLYYFITTKKCSNSKRCPVIIKHIKKLYNKSKNQTGGNKHKTRKHYKKGKKKTLKKKGTKTKKNKKGKKKKTLKKKKSKSRK